MTTTFNVKSVKNIVTVNQLLKAEGGTVKKTSKNFTLKATLKTMESSKKVKRQHSSSKGKPTPKESHEIHLKSVIKSLKKAKHINCKGYLP